VNAASTSAALKLELFKPRLDPLQHELQSRPIELLGFYPSPVRDKPAPLQTLCPQTKSAAIPVQTLQIITAPAHEHKELPGVRGDKEDENAATKKMRKPKPLRL
jgi:hypothetical protein